MVQMTTESFMSILILYIATAATFLLLDAIMLNYVLAPMFRENLGDLMLATPRFGPAIIFYLGYVAGVIWLVSLPAMSAGEPFKALIGGMILGAMAYGTYEFTNYATLRVWTWQMVSTDVIWGAVLTGVSAWVGVMVAGRLAG